MPDPENPKLFHVYITFSLEIPKQLARGIIILGIGIRRNNLDVAEDDDALELSDEEDDDSCELPVDCSCEDPDDDPFEDPGDSVDFSVAGSSTSPSALCATETSLGKRPISPAKEASAKRPCVQGKLSSLFTKPTEGETQERKENGSEGEREAGGEGKVYCTARQRVRVIKLVMRICACPPPQYHIGHVPSPTALTSRGEHPHQWLVSPQIHAPAQNPDCSALSE